MNSFWSCDKNCAPDESIGFVVFLPRHFKDDAFEPASLMVIDQLKEGSVSGVRLNRTSPFEIDAAIVKPTQKPNKPQSPVGLLIGIASEIEDIKTAEGAKSFGIKIDGTRENPAHVMLGFINHPPNARLMRAELFKVLLGGNTEYLPPISTSCSWLKSNLASHPIRPKHQFV